MLSTEFNKGKGQIFFSKILFPWEGFVQIIMVIFLKIIETNELEHPLKKTNYSDALVIYDLFQWI